MKKRTLNKNQNISACILAGGEGKRMGGKDKGLIRLAGKPLVSHVLDRIGAQVEMVYVNANRNLDQYKHISKNIVTDESQGFQGPLAGILAALKLIRTTYVAFVPCDSPFFPSDLVTRLLAGNSNCSKTIRVACDNGSAQPVFAVIPTIFSDSLSDYLDKGGRKIINWYESHRAEKISFSNLTDFDNLNNPQDFLEAEKRIERSENRNI